MDLYQSQMIQIFPLLSEQMNPLSVTTNKSDTNCSGTFQVSSDSFINCIK